MELLKAETAEQVIELLRPSNPYWCTPPGRTGSWYFRGQADATWPLVARAYRDQVFFRQHVESAIDPAVAELRKTQESTVATLSPESLTRWAIARVRLREERLLVNQFFGMADELGLINMSRDRRTHRDLLERALNWRPDDPSPKPDDITALAQHHGIPTRLLDWTSSPLGAAWFAASEAAQLLMEPNTITTCAVWAVSAFSIPEGRIKLVVPDKSPNPFLRAQRGAFTWDRGADQEYVQAGTITSQDRLLDNTCPLTNKPGLTAVVFPAMVAAKLAHLLQIEGTTRAHLMPTLDNVAEVLFPKWLKAAWRLEDQAKKSVDKVE